MLTDYHLHLRPDEPDASPEQYFTEANVDRYLEAAATAGIEELGVSEHIDRFTQSLTIWDHPSWRTNARDDLSEYCEFVGSTPLRLGIEMDYLTGCEDRIASVLDAHPFDYVVGSVHFIRDRAVDWDVYDIWEAVSDPDRVWQLYFDTLVEAVHSGLYDILAHPDLVKVWGGGRPLPKRDPRFYYEPVVEAIAEVGIAVEVSTAGWRKPVGELYPADAFAEMCVDAGVRVRALLRCPPPRACRPRIRSRRGEDARLGNRSAVRIRAPSAPPGAVAVSRVGVGYDSHRFAAGGRLVLGGVEIEHKAGLEGHSDADVVAHAVIDALLGAAALGDLGTHFPPTEERWRDADSLELMRTVVGMLNGPVVNVDVSVICEQPQLAPHREQMEHNISEVLSAPVSVKASSNEGMGFVGRGEGIACIAVASIDT